MARSSPAASHRKQGNAILSVFLALSTLALCASPLQADTDEDLRRIGDAVGYAIPISALVSTFFVGAPDSSTWDRQGTKQFALSFGASWLTMMLGKQATSKRRPQGTADDAYPSGHATLAFSGASFLQKRYGGIWGAMGYAGALFVAYSRVVSDFHFGDDVLAGASNGVLWTQAFVTPHESRDVRPGRVESGLTPRWRYRIDLGSAYLQANRVSAPADGGTEFDLNNFDKIDDPTMTAVGDLFYTINSRQDLKFTFRPFESRDEGEFPDSVFFGGRLFLPNTQLESNWRQYDVSGLWRYATLDSRHFGLQLGLGLMLQNTAVALTDVVGGTETKVEETTLLPFAHGRVALRFARRWGLSALVEGISLSQDWFLKSSAQLDFRLTPHWDFGVGYVTYNREISSQEFQNRSDYQAPFGAVAYSW